MLQFTFSQYKGKGYNFNGLVYKYFHLLLHFVLYSQWNQVKMTEPNHSGYEVKDNLWLQNTHTHPHSQNFCGKL